MKRPPRPAALVGGLLLLSACVTTDGDRSGSNDALAGTEWVVEEIAGRGVIDDARATLVFGPDRLSGNTSCNRYFADYQVDGPKLRIGNAGTTRRACAPAVMDQERRLLDMFSRVEGYRIEGSMLVLSTPTGATLMARSASGAGQTSYRCADGSIVEASYPTTDTARILYDGGVIDMTIAVSASGARYVGGGWEWWTKGTTEGTLSALAPGEEIASAPGISCAAI